MFILCGVAHDCMVHCICTHVHKFVCTMSYNPLLTTLVYGTSNCCTCTCTCSYTVFPECATLKYSDEELAQHNIQYGFYPEDVIERREGESYLHDCIHDNNLLTQTP